MDFEKLIEYMIMKYNCHTIILYGSFAKDDYDEESDIDILGFSSEESEIQDKSIFEGRPLDLWVYKDSKMNKVDEFIHVRAGKILLDKNNRAQDFLSSINTLFEKGPECLSEDSKLNSIKWLEKMLSRTLKQDVEGQYRLHWLLTDILPIYFEVTDKWYLGSKESFAWLIENDKEAYHLFKRMYEEPNENHIKAIISLMERRIKSLKTMECI